MTDAQEATTLRMRARAAWIVIRTGETGANPRPQAAPSPETPSPAKSIELAERAYKEVLDATKHQDDKVGRFLTAIAFLTTGAITLIASGGALRREFDVPGGAEHPLLAWSTGAFFALTLASVALLLLCLSVPVRLPKSKDDSMAKSHLFYSYIANRPRDDWMNHWASTDAPQLEQSIAEDYYREAHNLAERTSAKYRHSYEASWLFVCALLFLGVSVYLRIIAEFEPDVDVPSDLKQRYLVGLAVIASIHVALQVYTRWVHDIRSVERLRDYRLRDRESGPSDSGGADDEAVTTFNRNVATYRQRRWTWTLVIPATVFSLVLALPVEKSCCGRAAALVAVGVATAISTWLTRPVWDAEEKQTLKRYDPKSWWFPVLATVVCVATAFAALQVGGVWRVAAIVLPPLVTGAVNLSRPAHSSLSARRRSAVRRASMTQ